MKHKLIILLLTSFIFTLPNLYAQHHVGVRNGYGIMGVSATPTIDASSMSSAFNPGIVYQYKHKKNFAFQAEFNYISKGYKFKENDLTQHIKSFELPILGQACLNIGRFRPYITGGAFAGYINKRNIELNGTTYKYVTDEHDRRFEYGIIGGAGAGFRISRIELQAEWRYQYAFSFLRDPHIDGITKYLNPTQMMISLTVLYRLGE